MTGYGRGRCACDGREITIELKSVNSRYLDISCKMPHRLDALEEPLKAAVAKACSRGKVDVSVRYRNERQDRTQVRVDVSLARSYQEGMNLLQQQLHLPTDLTIRDIAGFSGVFTVCEQDEDLDAVRALMDLAVAEAAQALVEMREREGQRIQADLYAKKAAIEAQLAIVERNASAADDANRERLMQKLQDFIAADETLRQRVLMEAAIIAERRSIDEEIVRLHSHLKELQSDLEQNEPVGRKLDFLVQEMNREVNTIGSKANDGAIAAAVIAMKSEIEKLREQIQNIE